MKTSIAMRTATLGLTAVTAAALAPATTAHAQLAPVQATLQVRVDSNVRLAPNTAAPAVNRQIAGTKQGVSCFIDAQQLKRPDGTMSTHWYYVPALGGFVFSGNFTSYPKLPTCKASEAINQIQGQASQMADCGPTSLVNTLRSQGVRPRRFDPTHMDSAHLAAAIVQARADMGRAGEVGSTDAENIDKGFAGYGIPHRLSTSAKSDYNAKFADSLAHVRNRGAAMVLGGNVRALSYWGGNSGNHFVSVVGYDSATKKYAVLDSGWRSGADRRFGTRAMLTEAQLRAFNNAHTNRQTHILVDRQGI